MLYQLQSHLTSDEMG